MPFKTNAGGAASTRKARALRDQQFLTREIGAEDERLMTEIASGVEAFFDTMLLWVGGDDAIYHLGGEGDLCWSVMSSDNPFEGEDDKLIFRRVDGLPFTNAF